MFHHSGLITVVGGGSAGAVVGASAGLKPFRRTSLLVALNSFTFRDAQRRSASDKSVVVLSVSPPGMISKFAPPLASIMLMRDHPSPGTINNIESHTARIVS